MSVPATKVVFTLATTLFFSTILVAQWSSDRLRCNKYFKYLKILLQKATFQLCDSPHPLWTLSLMKCSAILDITLYIIMNLKRFMLWRVQTKRLLKDKNTRKLFYFASLNSKHEEGWANCIIGPSHTDAVNQFTHKAGYYQNTGNYQQQTMKNIHYINVIEF